MKTIALAGFLLFAPTLAHAVCDKLEFAEMDAMSKEDLLSVRCKYNAKMADPELYKAGAYGLAIGNKCSTESGRMDRIIARKYALKESDKGNDDIPYYVAINSLCRK